MNISLAHLIWLLSLKIKNIKFKYFVRNPQFIQQKILKNYLKKNKNTKYGKKHNFSKINTIEEFQNRIPIVEYNDLKKYINEIKNGKKNILSKHTPHFFEETSGSSNISKLIPYDSILKKEFISAIAPWMTSLNKNFDGIFKGRSYWSISPSLKRKKKSFSLVKIGIENDSEYLNKIGYILSKYLLLDVKQTKSANEFYIQTLKKMYDEKNLGFISVYSPTFLIQLNKVLRNNWNKIIPISENIDRNSKWSDIFKNVKLISCWLDSSSAQFSSEIKSFVGKIPILAKGLLSTECIVSFNYISNYDPILAITSHFYEFLSQKDNKIYLSHNLEKNEKYEVIVSTGNGFMRYRTHDIIEVTDFYKSTPTLKFIGRNNKIVDIVGEKISEIFCIEILEGIEKKYEISNLKGFFYLKKTNSIFNYNLALCSSCNFLKIEELNNFVKLKFNKNLYYDQAVRLGQLKESKSHFISKKFYEKKMNNYFMIKKIKDGNKKPPVLFNLDDSLQLFSEI